MWHWLKIIWSTYPASSLQVKLRILGRYIACPYNELVEELPLKGHMLDVGCGHGLLAVVLSKHEKQSNLTYYGIDHDEKKLSVAKGLRISNVKFCHQDLTQLKTETFDCVVIVDVLYCIPLREWPEFLENCQRLLKPEGSLLIKETIYWIECLLDLLLELLLVHQK